MQLRHEIVHTTDWSDCVGPMTCLRADHLVTPNLTSRPWGQKIEVAQMPSDAPVKKVKKLKKDKSRELTAQDVVNPVLAMPAEHLSSVEIKQTAKGEPVVEVKIYSKTTLEEARSMADIALKIYRQVRGKLDGDAGGKSE